LAAVFSARKLRYCPPVGPAGGPTGQTFLLRLPVTVSCVGRSDTALG